MGPQLNLYPKGIALCDATRFMRSNNPKYCSNKNQQYSTHLMRTNKSKNSRMKPKLDSSKVSVLPPHHRETVTRRAGVDTWSIFWLMSLKLPPHLMARFSSAVLQSLCRRGAFSDFLVEVKHQTVTFKNIWPSCAGWYLAKLLIIAPISQKWSKRGWGREGLTSAAS